MSKTLQGHRTIRLVCLMIYVV